MNLSTPRLRLRLFQAANINVSYLAWLNDSEVNRFSNQRYYEHTATSCAAYLAGFEGSINSFLMIEQRQDQRHIGTAAIYRSYHHRTANIVLMLGERSCWGQGFGREAWKHLLNALLAEQRIRKVTGGTVRPNEAMVSILESTEMALEAIRPKHEIVEGFPVDVLYYAAYSIFR